MPMVSASTSVGFVLAIARATESLVTWSMDAGLAAMLAVVAGCRDGRAAWSGGSVSTLPRDPAGVPRLSASPAQPVSMTRGNSRTIRQ